MIELQKKKSAAAAKDQEKKPRKKAPKTARATKKKEESDNEDTGPFIDFLGLQPEEPKVPEPTVKLNFSDNF